MFDVWEIFSSKKGKQVVGGCVEQICLLALD